MNTLNCIDKLREARRASRVLSYRTVTAVLLAVALGILPAAALDVRGPSGSVSLSSIAGSDTLVTVVLKIGAEDPNLKVLEVRRETISFGTDDGGETVYRRADIDYLKVQGSVVARREPVVLGNVALRPEDQQIVDRASARAAELFNSSKDNQELRIKAAAYMAFDGNEEAAKYLTSLAESNNLRTRIDAARGLYLAGEDIPSGLIEEGLESSNRNIRAATAVLAGLFRHRSSEGILMEMFNDRSAQYAAPAAVALARLGNREIIPRLFDDMIGSISDEKNDAGVHALIILGGEEVIEAARYLLNETEGLERFRLIRVLFELGDEGGRKELIRVFNEELTITPEAALMLAGDKYWEATQYLQERLKRREDDTPENLAYRARNATAILSGGDNSAVYVYQDLLRREDADIKMLVLDLIAEYGGRSMLKLIQTSIVNVDPELSMVACNTAMAIANPTYRQRLQDLAVSP